MIVPGMLRFYFNMLSKTHASIMPAWLVAVTAFTLTASGPLHAQALLKSGDTVTWIFRLQYSSTETVNSPSQPFGGHVILDYSHGAGAGSLDYRLDFLEDFTSTEPVLTLDIHHLTGLHDQTGMPLIWLPEFSPPGDAWHDLDGVLRLTILSGEMRNVTPQISMLLPTTPGQMDYYEAVVIPEPSSVTLAALGTAVIGYRSRKRVG